MTKIWKREGNLNPIISTRKVTAGKRKRRITNNNKAAHNNNNERTAGEPHVKPSEKEEQGTSRMDRTESGNEIQRVNKTRKRKREH